MRIGIREQLGLLVLLTTLTALAVVAIATVISPRPPPLFENTPIMPKPEGILMHGAVVGQ